VPEYKKTIIVCQEILRFYCMYFCYNKNIIFKLSHRYLSLEKVNKLIKLVTLKGTKISIKRTSSSLFSFQLFQFSLPIFILGIEFNKFLIILNRQFFIPVFHIRFTQTVINIKCIRIRFHI